MLAKNSRLNLKKDFKWVTSSAKVVETKNLKMFLRIGENTNARVGIALSGKKFDGAVERNRAKRLTSAAFEPLMGNLPGNLNIVVLPKSGILEEKSGDVLMELEEVLKREKVIE